MSLRSLASRLLLPLLLALGLSGHAAAAGTNAAYAKTLGELYDVARLMDAAVLDMNMMLGEDQSPVYRTRLEDTLKKLEAAQKTSAASLADSGMTQGVGATIGGDTASFIRLARENLKTILQTGAPENAVVDEMWQSRADARAAIDTVYGELEQRAGLKGSPLSEARALALLLEQMSSLYVENASAAYVSNRSQDSKSMTIDQMAASFGKRLDQILVRAKGEEASKLVRSIQSKWHFIEHSMMHYQEKTVPFLVDRYTQAIVTDLMSLAQVLEKQG